MRRTFALAAFFTMLASFVAGAGDRIDGALKKADELISKAEFSRARAELDSIVEVITGDDARIVRWHEREGAAWLGEGKVEEARASFLEALQVAKRLKAAAGNDAAHAYTGLGVCLRREGNDAFALKFFKKALTADIDEGTRMFAEDQIRELEGAPPLPAR